MKELRLTEVFCEVLGGLALLLASLPVLDFVGVCTVSDALSHLRANLSLTLLAGLFLVCYLGGILVDALSLSLGESFLDALLVRAPAAGEVSGFWKGVTQHVLSYRDTQWAYFSCYRNLAVLGVPGGLLWLVLIWRDGSPWWALSFLAGVAVGELVLFRSMKALLGGYYAITKAVSS